MIMIVIKVIQPRDDDDDDADGNNENGRIIKCLSDRPRECCSSLSPAPLSACWPVCCNHSDTAGSPGPSTVASLVGLSSVSGYNVG